VDIHALREETNKLAREVGPNAEVSMYFGSRVTYGDSSASISIYPEGLIRSDRDAVVRVYAEENETAESLFRKARSQWEGHKATYAQQTVEEMALEIIRIQSLFGSCTDTALRPKFGSNVALYAKAAADKANQMAADGPFTVLMTSGANGAPDDSATEFVIWEVDAEAYLAERDIANYVNDISAAWRFSSAEADKIVNEDPANFVKRPAPEA